MNGARTTFMRRGYLLTALSALLLLAASVGTASAQQDMPGVTITGPSMNTVNEGGTATYTVSVKGYVGVATGPNAADANNPPPFMVTLSTLEVDSTNAAAAGEAGEADDLNANAHVRQVSFDPPPNSSQSNRLLFTASKTISVATLHDNDAENERFTLGFDELTGVDHVWTAATGGTNIALGTAGTAARPDTLIIDDDETQTYKLTLAPGQTPTEGTPFTVNLTASPAHMNGSGSLQVNIDKQQGWTVTVEGETSGDGSTTVGNAENNPSRAITITQAAGAANGDGNRVADTVTVSAHTGRIGASKEEASLSIDVADANLLQAVTAKVVDSDGVVLKEQPTSVEEGKSVKIRVMPLNKDGKVTTADEALEVALSSSGSADARDYRLSAPIQITAGQNNSNVVDLIVETDEDVGMEMLMLDATVSGERAKGTETKTVENVLEIGIDDATKTKIEPKSEDDAYPAIQTAMEAGAGDDGLNPGEMFEVSTDDLFTVSDGYSASYGSSVEGDAVSVSTSGSTVMINAVKAGEAKVTVTATAEMAGSNFQAEQTVSNVAMVTFPVMVTDKMLALTLDAPGAMEGNVVEGMDYDVTVTANRAVHEDTEVTFMRSDMSEADVRDYSIEGVTIMAGEMMATATLMVTEDMMDDAGHAMGEALHLYAMAGDTMSNTLELTIWDEAVPALPLIGQLLLALFLMAGGARLYRRRQS